MKKFMFLSIGFEKPTPEVMGAWQKWFESVADRTVEQGGLWGKARSFTKEGSQDLSLDMDAITGYLIFTASSFEEAAALVKACPVVASNRVYEIMAK